MLYQLQAALMGSIDICALFVVLVAVIVTPALLSDFVKKFRRNRGRESRLYDQQYQAERDIRNIRRNAAREMLRAERECRNTHDGDEIVEGVAIEVRP
jgi:hypothetical protein